MSLIPAWVSPHEFLFPCDSEVEHQGEVWAIIGGRIDQGIISLYLIDPTFESALKEDRDSLLEHGVRQYFEAYREYAFKVDLPPVAPAIDRVR